MFCVIQEIPVKTVPCGESKEIEVYESTWTINGMDGSAWRYRYSDEYFERPTRKSYRISIHKSYRVKGKVKKKQMVICTVGYYDIIDYGSWIGDYVNGCKWQAKVDTIGLPEDELVELIYKKFQPIIDRVEEEFRQTEEYKAREEHKRIINEHNQRVAAFVEKYGVEEREYNRCYDVFGNLRNAYYLKQLELGYKARKEYERRSQENSRSYYDDFNSNYSKSDRKQKVAVNKDGNQDMLKKFYRTLSKTYHPDSNPGKDTSEEMKLLNQLKGEWGI